MRTLFVALVALVMTLLLGPTVIVARLLRVPQAPNSIYARAIRLWARTISRAAGVTIVVHGRERLSGGSGRVYVANHVSWFDIFALASEVPWCSFVAKAELRRIPLFGFAAEAAGIVFLDRENRKRALASYEVAAKEVQRGRGIIVCPEGTRGRDYHLRPFKKGPFELAIAAQAPIVPTIVHGTLEVMRKGSFKVRAGVIDIHSLEPIETAGLTYDQRADVMQRVWRRMADVMRDLYGIGTNEFPIAREKERSA